MKKDLLALGFVIVLIYILISGTNIQSVDEYYLTHIDDITENSETVTLSICCDTIIENWDKLNPSLRHEKYVPKYGVILKKTKYVLRPGDTVFEVLKRAVKHNKIQMEYQGADENLYNSVYIQGINHIYEFSCGHLSGWMFRVNGKFPNYGCSRYVLKNNDNIEFIYTCNLGKDIGGEFK